MLIIKNNVVKEKEKQSVSNDQLCYILKQKQVVAI